MEQKRPLRLAIVGEFNAGKSTFINALLGVDVAPTGVLPTTATLHWVAWAPDPFARIVVRGAADRVVPHAELKASLAKLQTEHAHVERVYIYAPIERLRHVEILDTPGFNAPDPDHAKAARSAFDEAHVVLWLLDAGGAMKASEMRILEELRAIGVPLLVLLNKADRLKPADLATVLAHVEKSLEEAKLEGYRPPIALSARLALEGRLAVASGQDGHALAASHFEEVDALLEESVVNRADVLRERGLRRKAAAIAIRLLEEARARSTPPNKASGTRSSATASACDKRPRSSRSQGTQRRVRSSPYASNARSSQPGGRCPTTSNRSRSSHQKRSATRASRSTSPNGSRCASPGRSPKRSRMPLESSPATPSPTPSAQRSSARARSSRSRARASHRFHSPTSFAQRSP